MARYVIIIFFIAVCIIMILFFGGGVGQGVGRIGSILLSERMTLSMSAMFLLGGWRS